MPCTGRHGPASAAEHTNFRLTTLGQLDPVHGAAAEALLGALARDLVHLLGGVDRRVGDLARDVGPPGPGLPARLREPDQAHDRVVALDVDRAEPVPLVLLAEV